MLAVFTLKFISRHCCSSPKSFQLHHSHYSVGAAHFFKREVLGPVSTTWYSRYFLISYSDMVEWNLMTGLRPTIVRNCPHRSLAVMEESLLLIKLPTILVHRVVSFCFLRYV